MCTVTYIPHQQNALLCSSRDEKNIRGIADPPAVYFSPNGIPLIYPKDPDKGGTWIALRENGQAAVLLNGGFTNHMANPPYRRSRGLIFLDIFGSEEPLRTAREIELRGIEPFTFICLQQPLLWVLRWDGIRKFMEYPDPRDPHIWSSVTLYPEAVRAKRKAWFAAWLGQNDLDQISMDQLLEFHHFGGEGDQANDIRMNRDQFFTVSITAVRTGIPPLMHYEDMRTSSQKEFNFSGHVS